MNSFGKLFLILISVSLPFAQLVAEDASPNPLPRSTNNAAIPSASSEFSDDMLLENLPVGSTIIIKIKVCIPKSLLGVGVQNGKAESEKFYDVKFGSVILPKPLEEEYCLPQPYEFKVKEVKTYIVTKGLSSSDFDRQSIEIIPENSDVKVIYVQTGEEDLDVNSVISRLTIKSLKEIFKLIEIHPPGWLEDSNKNSIDAKK